MRMCGLQQPCDGFVSFAAGGGFEDGAFVVAPDHEHQRIGIGKDRDGQGDAVERGLWGQGDPG